MIKSNPTSVTFVLIDGVVLDSEGEMRTVYGVKALDHQGKELLHLEALCTDKQLLSDFIDLCNRERVSAVHAHDVLEDFALRFYLI